MANFDFLEGFEGDGDWGFTSVKEKPSEEQSKQTETVVRQTADSTAKAVSSDIVGKLDTKLDRVISLISATKTAVSDKNQVDLDIAKKQMDDEYDLRKDNLGKEQKEKFAQLEKLIIPLLVKLAKSPEAYIHWPNRGQVIEAQVKKIIAITRGK